jgi:hypothetical protein
VSRSFKTAVSLHGHTNRSKESLSFISEYAGKHTVLRRALARQERRAKNVTPNLKGAYWTPPLTPREAYDVERGQIVEKLGLKALVSLTDHDNIDAPMLLQFAPGAGEVPVSVEWSVPFGSTVFHLGVHNLPKDEAASVMEVLAAYTANPVNARLSKLMGILREFPDTMMILNHPMWDLAGIGASRHRREVEGFLSAHNHFIDALELGGLRGWRENQQVASLAHAWSQPVIAGGDRHGAEPSATLNLTNASTFSEFVSEVRRDRHSHVLFMPQYRHSLALRTTHTLLDVIREYPNHPLGPRWDDRVFHPDEHGVIKPLSSLWSKPPQFIENIFWVFRLLELQPVRNTMALFGKSHSRIRLPLPGGEAA